LFAGFETHGKGQLDGVGARLVNVELGRLGRSSWWGSFVAEMVQDAAGSVMKAMIFIFSPHLGQVKGSMS
jgi:hypothetical protein